MKKMKSGRVLVGLFVIFIISTASFSCATTKANRIETQRKGLMIQDKSQYSMNKKYKGSKSKSFKRLKKINKRMKRRRR